MSTFTVEYDLGYMYGLKNEGALRPYQRWTPEATDWERGFVAGVAERARISLYGGGAVSSTGSELPPARVLSAPPPIASEYDWGDHENQEAQTSAWVVIVVLMFGAVSVGLFLTWLVSIAVRILR